MQLIDGKKTALEIQADLAEKVKKIKKESGKIPHLAAVLVGNDGASQTYVNAKVKACERVGFKSSLIRLEQSTSQEKLLSKISSLNQDSDIDGFIVQLPLPKHIDVTTVIEAIAPEKDVDGFHPVNVGRMVKNLPCYVSATPLGILKLLEKYHIDTSGKHCVVIGRSQIVGTPMSILMGRNSKVGNCTVTLCHSRTQNIENFTKRADIIVVALGIPEYLKADMIKESAVVIDVGITRVEDASKKRGYRLVGDVAFEEVSRRVSYITPVPGGVGPMTVTALLLNTFEAAQKTYY